MAKSMKLGGGGRFEKLEGKLASRKGKGKVSNPGALAAWIGRKKYGKARFQKLSTKGRARRQARALSKDWNEEANG